MKEYKDLTIKEFLRILFFSVVALVCVSLFLFWLLNRDNFTQREFSSSIWKADKEKRVEIIDDLIHKQRLNGLSKQEVIRVLGTPDEATYFLESSHDMLYYLGPERSFVSMDSEWLLIWLNDDNFVEKYEIGWD